MFCSRCGSEITGKSKFCPSCGLDLMATTPVHAIATGALQETDLVREALAAEYEIIEELGRGGMALVYRARDRQLEREVAIKVLPFSLAFDSEFVERFQREARTAAQLEHPNIIPIYRVGRSGRVIYFVMKFLRGGSLSTVMAERRKLTPPEIRRLLLEAGSALGYAAQRGIVHRDIKPDNIMFDEFGQCVLTDFGIAKAASGQRLTGTGMSIGTPHYMSPEQARAQPIDGRSDIYSLGVVAYQSLTGTVPYDGEDSFSIGYKHITEPVPTPQLITADERRLFEVIKRMLMKDPADRFQSCEELVASLQGQPIAAAGSVRASVAAAVGAGAGSTVPSPVLGGPALIVSQPTTPLDSPLVNRRMTPRERRDAPRRVADRSVAMRRGGSGGLGWLWLTLAIAGGVGGPTYYYSRRGFAPFAEAAAGDSALSPADSALMGVGTTGDTVSAPAAAPPGQPAESTVSPASGSGERSSPPAPSAAPVRPPAGSRPTPPRATAPPRAAATSGDSGSVRLVGLPRGSKVLIDERPVLEPVTRLAAGAHVLAVSAPRFNFFTDTIVIRGGDTLELTPELQPLGAPVQAVRAPAPGPSPPEPTPPEPAADRCAPGPAYNADGCFDERPKPVEAPFVPRPDGLTGEPRPSQLWVKVSAEGRTVDVQELRASDDPAFERAARDVAWSVTWHPALKDGAPVEAWTQMLFPPQPQQ
jgi:serine/threonine protein kinase